MGEEPIVDETKKRKRSKQENLSKAEKKEARAKKKAEKEAALAKVPKVDQDGTWCDGMYIYLFIWETKFVTRTLTQTINNLDNNRDCVYQNTNQAHGKSVILL